MDDLSRFCCPNSECPDFGKRGGENLSMCDHYGPNKQRRMLRCRTCRTRFSERKGTPLFGSTLPEEKTLSLLEHIAEGCGVRKTYCFSKDWDIHDAVTYFTMYTYNFGWPVRTLRPQGPDKRWLPRTPAMAAGLTDQAWSLWVWLTFPAVQRE